MDNEIWGMLLTLFLGVFILVGSLIVFFVKNNEKFIKFSIGMAFGVMLMLVLFDLLPEAIEIFQAKYEFLLVLLIVLGLCLLGIGLLKIFDRFIPDHEHDANNDEENLQHIGIVSSVALVLHNIIEGMAIYSVFMGSFETALLLSVGIGLHNIPLGMIVASAFYKANGSIGKTLLISFGLSVSTFIGGLLMYLLSGIISEAVIGILLGITLGMIIYIAIFELLPHILNEKNKKLSLIGIISGILLIVVSLLFHHH